MSSGNDQNKENQNLLKTLAKLNDDQLIRGSTPKDIEEKCLHLCQAYIQGSWTLAGVEDITISRITGGLTNQLYKVQLKETAARSKNPLYAKEPSVVAIKLYETKHLTNYQEGNDQRLNDHLILSLMSQTGIGPKVFGIFSDGVLQAFHEHEQFSVKHQQNPKLLGEVATLLARVHALNVPIRKTDHFWVISQIRKNIELGNRNYNDNVNQLIEELQLATMRRHKLADELEKLEKLHRTITSPTVFCHCDFRGSNILITSPGKKILLVDFEYSAYCCRAMDIATFIMEWGQARFDFQNMGIPVDSIIEHFLQLYIDACEEINPGYSDKPGNELPVILRETKIFILTQYLFFTAFSFKQTKCFHPAIPFDAKNNLKIVEKYYSKYHQIKQQLLDYGTI